MGTCTKNVNARCENEATEILYVAIPGGRVEAYPRCAGHPAVDDATLIRRVSPLATLKIVSAGAFRLTASCYHPDPEIDAGVAADAADAERADLAAGYPPRRWRCTCGAEHSRGHFGAVGVHRCMSCGYVGTEGVMLDDDE